MDGIAILKQTIRRGMFVQVRGTCEDDQRGIANPTVWNSIIALMQNEIRKSAKP